MTHSGDHVAPHSCPESGQRYTPGRAWQPSQYSPQAHLQRLGYPRLLAPGQPRPTYSPRRPHFLRRRRHPARASRSPSQPQYAQPRYSAPQLAAAPPRRAGAETGRYALAGIAGFALAAIGISVAAGVSHSAALLRSFARGNASGGRISATAGIGSAIILAGSSSGEQLTVTVTRVLTGAPAGTELARAGDQLYAVQFRLRDTGGTAYSDSPAQGAEVTDASGQSYDAVLDGAAAGCAPFPGRENIAAGSSGLGCVVFAVPKAAKITQVQFTLDSGLGPDTGQWDVG